MKKSKSVSFIAFALVLLTLLTTVSSVAIRQPEKALAINELANVTDVYYFTDSEPLMSSNEFYMSFSVSITYDINVYMTDQILTEKCYNGEFSIFNDAYVFIFELKYDMISPSVLTTVFSTVKNQGCYIIFISAYNLSEYSNTSFMQYVDDFALCNKDPFFCFVKNAVENIMTSQRGLNDSVIFIDGRLLYPIVDIGDTYAIEDMCYVSAFLRILFRHICQQLGITYTPDDYEAMIEALNAYNVHLLVNVHDYHFVDLMQRDGEHYVTYDFYSFEDVENVFSNTIHPLYAIGRWSLTQQFYNLLIDIQAHYQLPVYAWVVDELEFVPDGLDLITDEDLTEMYEPEYLLDYDVLDVVALLVTLGLPQRESD